MNRYKRVLFVSDIHCPYQDNQALKAMYSFMDWWKPNEVILLGDLVDFYAISHFSKDPERALKLQNEIDESVVVLDKIRSHAGKVPITLLEGNHEVREEQYLWNRASELSGLKALKLENLLELDRLKIKFVKNGIMHYKGIIVKHGSVIRKFAGYTAKGEFEKNGVSGISAHTHRLATYRQTNEGGAFVWVESGCLCKLEADYLKGEVPNWMQGFTIGYFKENSSRFLIETVPIINKKAMYGGREFGGELN